MYLIYLVLIIAILIPGGAWASMDLKYGQFRVLEIRKLLINMIYCNFAIISCVSLTYYFFGLENSYFELINSNEIFVTESKESSEIYSKEGFERTDVIDEIGLSVLYAMILTILWLYVSNNDMITWFLTKIKATSRKDEGAIWNKTLDTLGEDFDYGHLYDMKNKLVYKGTINAYSRTESVREILFLDVKVFDFNDNLQSKAPYLYVSCPVDQVRLELFNKGEV